MFQSFRKTKIGAALSGAAMLALAACNTLTAGNAAKTIGEVANFSLPLACDTFAVAQGYFKDKLTINSAKNISAGNVAIASVEGICANPNKPPTTIANALADLNAAWVKLQAATTVPGT